MKRAFYLGQLLIRSLIFGPQPWYAGRKRLPPPIGYSRHSSEGQWPAS
jgi:hypothetical protein